MFWKSLEQPWPSTQNSSSHVWYWVFVGCLKALGGALSCLFFKMENTALNYICTCFVKSLQMWMLFLLPFFSSRIQNHLIKLFVFQHRFFINKFFLKYSFVLHSNPECVYRLNLLNPKMKSLKFLRIECFLVTHDVENFWYKAESYASLPYGPRKTC